MRKLAIELLFAALAIAFILAIPPYSASNGVFAAEPGRDRVEPAAGKISRAESVKIKRFMERVAMSYAATSRVPDASVAAAVAGPSRPTSAAGEGGL